jgi:ACS family hexuronate transporter-like MFS transporter
MSSQTEAMPILEYDPRSEGTSPFRWVVCFLLFLATTINYMDRQVLGLLAPTLEKVIGWNEVQYGEIVVAFQAAYAIGQIGCGWMIDRWGTKIGYAVSIVIWSIAAAAHAVAGSLGGFKVARFALGIGEAGNFPAAIKAIAEWFPKRERALATGLFNSGSTVGAIAAPLVVSAITATWGWQASFVALGALGFGWLVLWLVLYKRPAPSRGSVDVEDAFDAATESGDAELPKVSWPRLLGFRQTWAYNIQSLCVQPIWWFYLFWLPKFFAARFGLELGKSAPLLAITYAMSMLGSISGGLLSAFLLRRGWSVNAGRKTALLACALLTVPMVGVASVGNVWVATFLIGLTLAGMQGWASNAYTIVSDLFPKRTVASVVGLGSACGSAAAMLMAMVVGEVLQRTGSYQIPFLIAGLSLPLAVTLLHVLVPRWDPIVLEETAGDGGRDR